MKINLVSLSLIVLFFSCNRIPKDVRMVLKASGNNRPELERVIDYYKYSEDKEKLKAAYFLIGNMDNKYSIDCEDVVNYDPIFNIVDSLERNHIPPSYNSPFIQNKWDSLVNKYGNPSFKNAKIVLDYLVIKASYLIETIDLSFQIRNESKWGKEISFRNFYEFVLAYRFSNEPLEPWRSEFYGKYKSKVDSINSGTDYRLAQAIHKIIPRAKFFNILMEYPYSFPFSKIEKVLKGDCYDVAYYNAATLRAIGLPVAVDYVPLFGNSSGSHAWNVLFLENGKPFYFERTKDTLELKSIGRAPKVFRKTYSKQNNKFSDAENDVPGSLLNNNRIDVTQEYVKTYDVNIKLSISPELKKKYAVICTFNNKDWVPQDFGRIRNGKVTFKNMGSGILYRPMYYDNGFLSGAGEPFILKDDGIIEYFDPKIDKTQDMVLLRKYRFKKQYWSDEMIKGYFEGAYKSDFSDSEKLFTILEMPEKIESVVINNSSKFRYIRFKSPQSATGNVAELWFYGGKNSSDTLMLKGKVIGYPEVNVSIGTPYTNAFDDNLETFFDRYTRGECWVGLDLGEPKRITKIKYCPRSDTNFILVGDTYELCYWDNGEWVSFGTQIAKEQNLVFENVPSGRLYILHDLTRGKEERIFTYENGLQVWW
jgi:hypothetical protein